MAAVADLAALLQHARTQPVVVLPRVEPHWAGMALGAGGLLLGLLAARFEFAGREELAWAALIVIVVAMVLHGRLRRTCGGWRVDFTRRRVEPADPAAAAAAEAVEGAGWSIQVAPGDKRSHVAIDLRHRDRGRVVRLVDLPARRRAQIEQVDELAATLARRLAVERSGPVLKSS